jgi:hypothetical protein
MAHDEDRQRGRHQESVKQAHAEAGHLVGLVKPGSGPALGAAEQDGEQGEDDKLYQEFLFAGPGQTGNVGLVCGLNLHARGMFRDAQASGKQIMPARGCPLLGLTPFAIGP